VTTRTGRGYALACTLIACGAAQAQVDPGPRRTRVTLGPQLVPNHPGAKGVVVRPFFNFDRARGDDPFVFEAPDESPGFSLWSSGPFSVGPALGFQGRRRSRNVGGTLPDVGFTVEAGGFAQYQITPAVRARGEVRQGLGGHRGLVGVVSVDWVARDGDDWLVSIGPRLTLANGRYHRAYFGVGPAAATPALPAFAPDGGIQAAGAAASTLRQITPRWGLNGYVKYDRLVGDAARSPVTRRFGSRDQVSGGVALSYIFGG
jgi:MipA family protein